MIIIAPFLVIVWTEIFRRCRITVEKTEYGNQGMEYS